MTGKNHLEHHLTLRNLFTFAFGSIIGVGWMILAGDWINGAGPGGAALGFVGGGFMIVLVAMSYAEIASMHPVSGGEVAYAYSVYGYKPAFGVAWFLALAYIVAGPFEFIAVGWVVTTLIPSVKGDKLYTLAGHDIYMGALVAGSAVAILIGYANHLGVKVAARLQDVLSYLLIAVAIVFVAFAFLNGDASNLRPFFEVSIEGSILPGFLAVLATTPLWFSGFDVVSQAMGEKSDQVPMSRLGDIVALAIVAAAIFYCLVIFATAAAVPRATLSAMDFPVAGAIEAAFDSTVGSKLVMIAALLGLITSWNAFFFAGTRLIFAMGRARMLSSWLSHIDPVRSTPSHAILVVFLVGFVGSLGRGAITPIIDMTALIYSLTFFLVCLGVILLRYRLPDKERPYRARSILIPILAATSMAWLFLLTLSRDLRSAVDGAIPPQWFAIAAWIVFGAIFWRLARPMREALGKEETDRAILEIATSE